MTRIILADDHQLVRNGLRRVLDDHPDMTVVAEADTRDELRTTVTTLDCDVVLLDINMHGNSTLDDLARLHASHPSVRFLVLSMYPDTAYGLPAIRAGASGYLSKDADPEEVVLAIRTVAGGGHYARQELAELALRQPAGGDESRRERLSAREREVMRGIAAGERVRDIAKRLGLNDRTVSTYRRRVLEKLGLSSNAEIAQFARERGFM